MVFFDMHSHNLSEEENALVILNQYPLSAQTDSFFSVGIHPWYLEDWEKQWTKMRPLASHQNCLAVGECGLDKNISTHFELQQEIFKKHIELSEELKKPLIIHCVKAYDEVIRLKKQYKPEQMWVIHGFRKNEKTALNLIKAGIKLSFGKALLSDESLQKTFRNLPQDSFFLETDNAHIPISHIYQKAIEIRQNLDDFTKMKMFFISE
ncbi:TatD family hydrolase [Capnocytophaga canimorsus]|uniref:TatD family hydrolase n=1 Tax=Capnocytophaga canimorsus TaxID=28188 RepID=UPI0037D7D738